MEVGKFQNDIALEEKNKTRVKKGETEQNNDNRK